MGIESPAVGSALRFLGAADTVTGSRYLVRTRARTLLVDCGLFQGLKRLRLRNREPFALSPARIDAVLLTHAHLDHSGYLPALVRDGFRGPIYCTELTRALAGLLLPDSAHLEVQAAERANRYHYSKHSPALPLYTPADVHRALARLVAVPFEQDVALDDDGCRFRFRRAGHILGAASIALHTPSGTLVFSGDLGRPNDPVVPPPLSVPTADWVVVESTYGDAVHPRDDPADALARVVNETAQRGGVVIIPAFAVGRAQLLLHHLAELRHAGRIPAVPVFMDSPMAADATHLLLTHPEEHRLAAEQCTRMRDIVTITNSVEESKAIDRRLGPMIVISASGMATGGRVLFHLERFGDDVRNTILLVGHQAAGTRGATLQAGARTLRMHGRDVPIHARVAVLDGLSAHADSDELIAWLASLQHPPRQVFVTHGEPQAADALRRRIQNQLGWPARVPEHGETVALVPPSAVIAPHRAPATITP